MAQFNIGEIIKDTRVRLGYSQEDLCFCDMELSTISRIERGDHVPQNPVLKKIFAQMNMNLPMNLTYVDADEFTKYQLQEQIENVINEESDLKYDELEIEETLEDFKNCKIKMDELDWQEYFLVKGILAEQKNDFTSAREFFLKAAKMTIPNFSETYDFSQKRTYFNNELRSVYEFAKAEFDLENQNVSNHYLTFLLDYLENGILDEFDRTQLTQKTLFTLCKLNYKIKNVENLLTYANKGIDFCVKKDNMFHLSDFLDFKGKALDLQNDKVSAKKVFQQSAILIEIQNKFKEKSEVQEITKNENNQNIVGKNTIAGILISSLRKKNHITQKQLCYGVCNQSTLARIENGEIMPSIKQIEAFFTRLGYSVPNNIVPISRAERERNNLEEQLSFMTHNRNDKRMELLKKYKECHKIWNKFYEQFYLMQNGIYEEQFDEQLRNSIKIFETALKLTIPEFCVEDKIPDKLFSITEVSLINNIAHSEYYLYDIEKKDIELKNRAIKRIRFLKKYFEDNFNNYRNWTMYSIILFNLTNWIGLDGNFEEAEELSKIGMKIEHISVTFLILHLYNYGYSLASLGKKQEAESYFQHFLKLYPLIDVYNDINETIDELNEKFGFNFSK